MQALIKFGADGLLFVVLAGAAFLFLRTVPIRRWPNVLPLLIMAGLTSLLVGKLLSLVFQPSTARPFIEKGVTAGAAFINNPGFPSDHMLLATVAVVAVWFLTPYRKYALLLGSLALLMGVARVLALVHTPIDIAGGIVAGLSGAVWYLNHRIANR